MTQPIEPAKTRPARLAALSKLPIFLDLAGKRVVIAGGGKPVAWKAELLSAAGAQVTVFSAQPSAELVNAEGSSAGATVVEPRSSRPADLEALG